MAYKELIEILTTNQFKYRNHIEVEGMVSGALELQGR